MFGHFPPARHVSDKGESAFACIKGARRSERGLSRIRTIHHWKAMTSHSRPRVMPDPNSATRGEFRRENL